MARTAIELRQARRRAGDGVDQDYNCMGEPDYEALRKAKGWRTLSSEAANR